MLKSLVNSICLSATLLITTVNLANAALTATTANTIQGTAPFLTYDNGNTKVTTTDKLLGIKIVDSATTLEYTPTNNASTAISPIYIKTWDKIG